MSAKKWRRRVSAEGFWRDETPVLDDDNDHRNRKILCSHNGVRGFRRAKIELAAGDTTAAGVRPLHIPDVTLPEPVLPDVSVPGMADLRCTNVNGGAVNLEKTKTAPAKKCGGRRSHFQVRNYFFLSFLLLM